MLPILLSGSLLEVLDELNNFAPGLVEGTQRNTVGLQRSDYITVNSV
jgi:hypothetical protein